MFPTPHGSKSSLAPLVAVVVLSSMVLFCITEFSISFSSISLSKIKATLFLPHMLYVLLLLFYFESITMEVISPFSAFVVRPLTIICLFGFC